MSRGLRQAAHVSGHNFSAQGHQTMPQRCHSKASLQLPTFMVFPAYTNCVMSCEKLCHCQWEGYGWIFFNHQFFSHTEKIPWSLLFSNLNNHISFSPYMRSFCYLIILTALNSGLKESVYEVVIGFSIYSEVLRPNSPMKITWITSILTSKFSSVLRSKPANKTKISNWWSIFSH